MTEQYQRATGADTLSRYDHKHDICRKCHAYRERHVDRQEGTYTMLLPSNCPHKEKCEAELLSGFTFTFYRPQTDD